MRATGISTLLALASVGQAAVLHERAAPTCTKDSCLELFQLFAVVAKPFCSTYTKGATHTVPAFAAQYSKVPAKISSACTCLNSGTSTAIPTSTSATAAASSSSKDIASVTTTSTPSATAAVSSSSKDLASVIITSTPSVTTPTATIVPADACYVTAYSAIPAATAACTSITLDGITVPGNSTIDLSKLKTGTKVTFKGTTFWEYFDANYPFIKVGGTNIEITAAEGAILDGNGQSWWDGLGSNGGISKPNHFIELTKVLGSSTVHDIYIQNYPVHCFSVSNSAGLDIHHITLNNSAGYAPNNRSNGLPASHNSDGFDFGSTNDTKLYDSTVINQDDCVAVTSGNNIEVSNMYCNGSHGLSIGSVGGKSNNNVTNISFLNSVVLNAENGARIKSNSNTTGFISDIIFENIRVENISIYGIDIQQDYLNGGPTGNPTNGVIIQNISIKNVTGTATEKGRDYYILCGSASCSNITINDVDITGGGVESLCNFKTNGNFDCDGHFV
ncbi:glycoside hydrolase family 28 protein [Dothidotthia symphoricarpi CBS 119687]|uniref:endo-polygalacturonase n=1 Tax=Dothidotthia symphoricarpi CBS 119687 TaxID=1392245 RepID=A0A6A6A780_9PLEO|nr:glycoside hydrolase family 28 protein [Dothidotthia symphoricarpi CBS 119687]KAF2127872.1 glycoside hydrolase family 28 protein [Dothidotthia symphoricarpi CBS 119687]